MNELIKISKYAGMREDLIQAGGGNTSVKLSDTEMLIKASGFQLADVTETEGFSTVNPQVIVQFFQTNSVGLISQEDEKELLNSSYIRGGRPSIETFLHSITRKVTLHTHPTLVNVLVSRKDSKRIIEELFPDSLYVSYATPGIQLAKEYFIACEEYQKQKNIQEVPKVIFLESHGLIVNAESSEEVISLTEQVIKKIADYLCIDNRKWNAVTFLYNKLKKNKFIKNEIVYLANDRRIYQAINSLRTVWNHTMCPDAVVYCGKKIWNLKSDISTSDLQELYIQYGVPTILYYQDEFYIIAPSVKKAKEIESLLAFSAEVSELNKTVEMSYLSEKEQNFLLNWDAEKFRKNMK